MIGALTTAIPVSAIVEIPAASSPPAISRTNFRLQFTATRWRPAGLLVRAVRAEARSVLRRERDTCNAIRDQSRLLILRPGRLRLLTAAAGSGHCIPFLAVRSGWGIV